MTIKSLNSNNLSPSKRQLSLHLPEAGDGYRSAALGSYLQTRRSEIDIVEHNRAAALLQQYFMKEHHASSHHFDFRIAFNRILASWAIPDGPSLCPLHRRRAIQMEDHKKEYVGFEGVFPDGKPGAGPTMPWDHGFYAPQPGYLDIDRCLRQGLFRFTIYGKKLKGNWTLTWAERTTKSQYGANWYLIKEDDSYATSESVPEITATAPKSVLSGRILQQVKTSFFAKKRIPQSTKLFDF